jgi:Recombinase
VVRIARALNDAGVPCPSAADPGRNPHRAGAAWTLGTVTTILRNPRYTGRQVWNRQRTDRDLADPADVSLGHKSVQRWNLPDGWVISRKPVHPALVSEADFIAAQDISAARGPVPGAGLISPDRGNHAITVTRPGRTHPGIPQRVRYLARYLAFPWLRGRCGHLLPPSGAVRLAGGGHPGAGGLLRGTIGGHGVIYPRRRKPTLPGPV